MIRNDKPPKGSFGGDRKKQMKPARPATPVVSPARKVAYTVLCDVFRMGAYASLALNKRFGECELKEEDRRLAAALVYGVIESTGKLDWLLDRYMKEPVKQIEQKLILRLGAYQILFLERVPDSAAVNEAVNQCRLSGLGTAAGFTNAVLRSIAREKDSIEWPQKDADPVTYLSVCGSVPRWLAERFVADYGTDAAEAMLIAGESGHAVTVRPNLMQYDDTRFEALLKDKGWRYEKALVPHAYNIYGTDVSKTPEFLSGKLSIQGQSSMLAAMAMNAKSGQKLLDACAAPGGKSAYLCETMQGTGRVYAWELHESRTRLLEGVRNRLHLDNMRVMTRDASQPREDWAGTLDGVLLDAPCSGTGVMRQKPDIKNRLRESDIEAITETQHKLLNAVCGYVRPGGTLIYSTCSVLKDENERQIERFLQEHPEFEMQSLPESIPTQITALCGPYGLQLQSGQMGLEGFFIAKMRRVR